MNNPYPEKLGITADSGRLFDVANPSHDAWNEAVVSLIKWLDEPCGEHCGYQVKHGIKTIIIIPHRKDCSLCWAKFQSLAKDRKVA